MLPETNLQPACLDLQILARKLLPVATIVRLAIFFRNSIVNFITAGQIKFHANNYMKAEEKVSEGFTTGKTFQDGLFTLELREAFIKKNANILVFCQ